MAKPKLTEAEKITAYMQNLQHPLLEVVQALRKTIAASNTKIGEEIKWNAPAFFYTGEMEPSDPKEYKKYIVVFNLAKKEFVRLVFLNAGAIQDDAGLLEGDYKDGRRMALFYHLEEVGAKEIALQKIINSWLDLLDK